MANQAVLNVSALALLAALHFSSAICWADETIHAESLDMDSAFDETRFQQRADEGTLSRMESALRTARQVAADDTETVYMEGMFARALGKPDLAENALLQALTEVPNFPRAYQALIELYIDIGRIESAEKLMLPLLDLTGPTPRYQLLLGRLAYRRGDLDQALGVFQGLENAGDSSPEALAARATYLPEYADTLRRLGRSEEAYAVYNQSMAVKPPSTDTWVSFGDLLNDSNEATQALDAYRRAYQQNPRTLDKLVSRAETAFWETSPEDGLRQFAITYKIAPNRTDLLLTTCDILYYLWKAGRTVPTQEVELAADFVAQQTDLAGRSSDALQVAKLQLLAIRQNGLSDADKQLLNQIGRGPNATLTRARAWLLLEAPEEAKLSLDNLSDADRYAPETPITLVTLNAWPYAQTYNQNPDIQDSVTRWGAREFTLANNKLNEGENALRQNQAEAALGLFAEALQHDLFMANGYFGIARAALAQKQKAQADTAYQIARSLGYQPQSQDPVIIKALTQLDPDYKAPSQKQRRQQGQLTITTERPE